MLQMQSKQGQGGESAAGQGYTWMWCSGRLSLLGTSTDSGCPGAGSLQAEIWASVGVAVTAGLRCATAAGGLALARHCFSDIAWLGFVCAKSSIMGCGSSSASPLSCFRRIISTCESCTPHRGSDSLMQQRPSHGCHDRDQICALLGVQFTAV